MEPVIEVVDLRKRYGKVVAVDGVSFSVGRGEIFGIVGPNGAGKSTTVECLAGLRRSPRRTGTGTFRHGAPDAEGKDANENGP